MVRLFMHLDMRLQRVCNLINYHQISWNVVIVLDKWGNCDVTSEANHGEWSTNPSAHHDWSGRSWCPKWTVIIAGLYSVLYGMVGCSRDRQ
jgi:hypothetical protein